MIGIIVAVMTPPSMEMVASCPTHQAEKLVGSVFDEQSQAAARAIVGTGKLRWIMPDAAVTQDWVPERLNIVVDEHARITRTYCG